MATMTVAPYHIEAGDFVNKDGQWMRVEYVNHANGYVETQDGGILGCEELTYDDIRLPSEMH